MGTIYTPQQSKIIGRQGVNFSNVVTAFDKYARGTSATLSSTLGLSKTVATLYFDQTDKWILGQLQELSINGVGVESFSFDSSSALPLSRSNFGKLSASYTFNTDGTLASIKDGLNHTTKFESYKLGTPQTVTYPDTTRKTAVVNQIGGIDSLKNEAGITTNFGYDAMGRLSAIYYPTETGLTYNATNLNFEQVNSVEYGLPAGHWRWTKSTGKGVVTSYLDGMWRERIVVTQDSSNAATLRAVSKNFDFENRPTFVGYPQATVPSITDTPKGTTTVYDPLGREISRTIDTELSPAQRTATNVYQSGFTTQTTDFNGNVSTSSFQAYDNPDKAVLASLSGPEGLNLSITRDAFGATTSMTKNGTSAGVTTSVTRNYVYDGYHQLCKTVEPELGATVQDWDAAGNLAWRSGGVSLTSTGSCDTASVPAAQKISYGYDARNRLTSTTFGDSSPAITRTYTDDGLPKTSTTNGNTWTYNYNNRRLLASQVMSINGGNFKLAWDFDANGNVSQLTYPDGTVLAYAPNALGEPTQVGTYATSITRFPNGAVKSYTFGNGITHTLTQNVRGLPLLVSDSGTLKDQYSYDANANVIGIDDQQENLTDRTLTYDGLNRLKTANGIWGSGSFTYDVQDNIRSSTVGSRSITHAYDPATNLLTGVSGSVTYAYAYDANGNITSRAGQAFVFDLGNRLTSSTGKASYIYDGEGRRTFITNAGGATHLQLYDQGGRFLYARRNTGSIATTKYVYLGTQLIAEVDSANGTIYTHVDGLGSPVARTDTAAAVLSRTRFEPFGKVVSGYSPTRPDSIGFTGHVYDADTGLTYMQQRYYDPIAGRFLSTDPVLADVSNGGNFGRYTYVDNNPYAKVDPDGRDAVVTEKKD
ncbi:RHS repeat-associated core domain-containing protein, partial [Ideonella sp. B508-1]|uniref:RHS repeat-associated core domain-containing protein n=1 Tax=Ideonella sp. B508-1 TaxID=137716 RepID=UPI001F469496